MATVTILSKDIRVLDGLYSLNDLHKISGHSPKHRPHLFLRHRQAQKLIQAIQFEPSKIAYQAIHHGINRGSWACKELVYAYALWIHPSFHLMVMRAFDQVQQDKQPVPILSLSTSDEFEKIQQLNNITHAMEFKRPVAILPIQEICNMISAIRMYQSQIANLQTPNWVEDSIAKVKQSANCGFADI